MTDQPTSTVETMWRDGTLVGRRVRCLGLVRRVIGLYGEIPGGVWLDRPVEGFVSWNVDALTLANAERAEGEG